jgi:hypothetical protein
VRQYGLGKLKKNSFTSGLELATFRPVAQCLNHYTNKIKLIPFLIYGLFNEPVSNSNYTESNDGMISE